MYISKRTLCSIVALFIILSCMALSVYGEEHTIDTCSFYDGSETFNILNSVLIEESKEKTVQYSDFINAYAGSKIRDDGTLIIFIKRTHEANSISNVKSKLLLSGVHNDALIFKSVEYSEKELIAFRNSILENIHQWRNGTDKSTHKNWVEKFVAASIDPEKNLVELYVTDFSSSDYEKCDQIFSGYPYEIKILPGGYDKIEETTLKPGQGISSTGGSIGFRCKLDGVKGFITATHASTDNNVENEVNVKINGVTIGKITAGKYNDKSDFAFVEITNSNYDVGRTTNTTPQYTLKETSYVISLPEGYAVYMAGKKSSEVRSGTVYRYDYAINPNSSWLLCDYPSESGDSGGCVFANVDGDYCIIGIHDGSYGSNYKYSTKLTTMKEYYNIVIY